MHWIDTTGGPLIMMAVDLVEHWNGIQGDYDRACQIYDWLGVVLVRGRQALIVNDEPMQTANWFTPDGLLLVQWNFAPDESVVVHHLETQAKHLTFPDSGLVVEFGSRDVALFDSESAGHEIKNEECLRLELPRSKCEIRTLDWRPDEHTRLIMHSFLAAD